MKIVTRYITTSILKTAIITLLVCVLLVLAVELFSSMNKIVTSSTNIAQIIKLSILGLPEYLMMVASVSFLFATTFFLSQLQANNELIMLYNTGFSYAKIAIRVVVLGIVVTTLFFYFSETVMIDAKIAHNRLSDELFGLSGTTDSRNITLSDLDSNYVIHTSRFNSETNTIYNATLIKKEENVIKLRVVSDYAKYSSEGYWIFFSSRIYERDNNLLITSYLDEYPVKDFTLEPRLFKNANNDVTTMDREDAINYLKRIKTLDRDSYYQAATDFYQRIFSPFSILILMVISVSMNYRFKKNVFLFSIIQSLCTAVVYYVALMVFTISSSQGITEPYLSVLLPIIIVTVLSIFVRTLGGLSG